MASADFKQMRLRLIFFVVPLVCCACSSSPTGSTSSSNTNASSTRATQPLAAEPTQGTLTSQTLVAYLSCMEDMAARADNTVEDGWFYGQDPRLFKSFYRKIPADVKAKFAVDYHNWIAAQNQDLVKEFKTYIPYSKRADFGMEWWSKREPRFVKQEKKMQVLWVHESIQDAGELWWRAGEKLGYKPVDTMQSLAHDEEQRMVAHFMENEGSPGSISDQVWKRTH